MKHPKLKEGRIKEVSDRKDKAEDEREMNCLRHVSHARLAGAGFVLGEGHHRVERKQERV